jgi:zinc D-Ala-D-Ala carboxypeptidase
MPAQPPVRSVRRVRRRGRRFVLVLVVVIGTGLAVPTGLAARVIRVVSGSPPAVDLGGPLPSCRADSVPAVHRAAADWPITLLDPMFTLAPTDRPVDLVPTAEAGIDGGGEVRLLVIDDLRAMARAARADGVRLRVRSAFRSYEDQIRTVDSLERAYGRTWTARAAAQPGHSEHQLGTAIDLDGGDGWLATHAWEHGFVVSYPPERSPRFTCYQSEPWHVRYVGRVEAAAVQRSGVSLREWLWAHPDGTG